MHINNIGFFQLDNLIKNRIPFLLLNMGPSISDWYMSLYKEHITKNQILGTRQDLMLLLESKKLSADAALILLCNNGLTSLEIHSELEQKGYTNVYVIHGGYQQLMTEHSSS